MLPLPLTPITVAGKAGAVKAVKAVKSNAFTRAAGITAKAKINYTPTVHGHASSQAVDANKHQTGVALKPSMRLSNRLEHHHPHDPDANDYTSDDVHWTGNDSSDWAYNNNPLSLKAQNAYHDLKSQLGPNPKIDLKGYTAHKQIGSHGNTRQLDFQQPEPTRGVFVAAGAVAGADGAANGPGK